MSENFRAEMAGLQGKYVELALLLVREITALAHAGVADKTGTIRRLEAIVRLIYVDELSLVLREKIRKEVETCAAQFLERERLLVDEYFNISAL